ncbi:hypothetical protein AVEN_229667-1 [Araneus ventricosus]|uniref:Uncharacterized protein n=1 Tax=Araneus ventricosus TaxID=182803 RepID=A0A4Y2LB28_ARAVE|nr:hypothetical protein AVEN_229667-1 [Araneus ventricosus]
MDPLTPLGFVEYKKNGVRNKAAVPIGPQNTKIVLDQLFKDDTMAALRQIKHGGGSDGNHGIRSILLSRYMQIQREIFNFGRLLQEEKELNTKIPYIRDHAGLWLAV